MVQLRQQLSIEPMREVDVPTVQEIERHIFSTPWPRNAYYRELSSRNSAYYIVLRREAHDNGLIQSGAARASTNRFLPGANIG